MAPAPTAKRPVRRRNRRGEGLRLRDDLVAAARTLLGEASSEREVTIRRVTRAVGVAPQAFYLHFKALDDLLFAAHAAEFSELLAALERAARGLAIGEASLRAMASAYVEFAVERPRAYRLMMSTSGAVHLDWDPAKLPGTPVLVMLRDALAACAPGAPGSLSPDAAIVQLWATLHGIVTLRASRPTFPWPPLDEMSAHAVDSALTAVKAPRAS